ncbi:hypothetical protein DFQ10_10886 [Winogradskyella eximia]|jgi:hypothetical protein|uniref:Heavy-metal resistance protein n=1 Tax=Winogradskyella eximia TaxID=262006 RepID=A0A3D9GZI9_9FLAO|nr:hypothetical protein [Winogradskyella eximia]RED42679.1 hypothetical protein DFQ10_10886 [Winogradskyella eximia]
MKKNNILYILVAFLIVVNGFFLFNYMSESNENTSKGPQGNRDFIVKELGFNKAQLAQFKENSQGHHQIMMRLSDEIKGLKDELFSKLSEDGINESTIDSISSLICEKEKLKDKEIFYHFKMIQELSNDKQKEKFKTIIKDALRQGDQGQRPPPPGEGKGHRPPPRNS